jgi:predicted 3-demethylubiquinone-9 3-methyltransferase (glyoxalase superfamily)
MTNPSVYQCLWFDNQGAEAAKWYVSLFDGTSILYQNQVITEISIEGTKLMMINGGKHYSPTSAMSNFVYFGGNHEKFERIYHALLDGGQILMPMDAYDWSSKYAWVKDKFGINWQMDIDEINHRQKLVPSLLFVNQRNHNVKEALSYYISVFEQSTMLMEWPYPESEASMPAGTLLFGQAKLGNTIINAMSSTLHHDYDFTPGNSLVIVCENQDEIDYYWKALGAEGQELMCGWLTDRFGLTWQIFPRILSDLMNDPERGPKASTALRQMKKIVIAKLLEE